MSLKIVGSLQISLCASQKIAGGLWVRECLRNMQPVACLRHCNLPTPEGWRRNRVVLRCQRGLPQRLRFSRGDAEKRHYFHGGLCCCAVQTPQKGRKDLSPAVGLAASISHRDRHSDKLRLGHWLLGLLKGHLTPRHSQQGWLNIMATLPFLCQHCLSLFPHRCQSPQSANLFCDANLYLLPGEPAL